MADGHGDALRQPDRRRTAASATFHAPDGIGISGVAGRVVEQRAQLRQGGEGLRHPFRRQHKELSNDGEDDFWWILESAGNLEQRESVLHYIRESPVPPKCQVNFCLEFIAATIEIKNKAGEEGIDFQCARQRGGAGIADLVETKIERGKGGIGV
jgi:hypothetical protein